jgi:hypothetical protein
MEALSNHLNKIEYYIILYYKSMNYISLIRALDVYEKDIADIVLEYVGGMYIPSDILIGVKESIEFHSDPEHCAECSIETEFIEGSDINIMTHDNVYSFNSNTHLSLFMAVIEKLGICGLDDIIKLEAHVNRTLKYYEYKDPIMDYTSEIEDTVSIFKYKWFCKTQLNITHYYPQKK